MFHGATVHRGTHNVLQYLNLSINLLTHCCLLIECYPLASIFFNFSFLTYFPWMTQMNNVSNFNPIEAFLH